MNALILSLMAILSTSTATLRVSSPSFSNGGFIPMKYSCEGKSINPAIEVKNIPKGVKTLALIMDDPDASHGTFDHWVIWNLEPGKTIGEDSAPGTEGNNSAKKKGYAGPCPPYGTGVHHYHFKVYALDSSLDLAAGASRAELEQAMKSHILAQGELIGLYRNSKDSK